MTQQEQKFEEIKDRLLAITKEVVEFDLAIVAVVRNPAESMSAGSLHGSAIDLASSLMVLLRDISGGYEPQDGVMFLGVMEQELKKLKQSMEASL